MCCYVVRLFAHYRKCLHANLQLEELLELSFTFRKVNCWVWLLIQENTL